MLQKTKPSGGETEFAGFASLYIKQMKTNKKIPRYFNIKEELNKCMQCVSDSVSVALAL